MVYFAFVQIDQPPQTTVTEGLLDMHICQNLDFDKFLSELLQMHIAQILYGGFPKSGHIHAHRLNKYCRNVTIIQQETFMNFVVCVPPMKVFSNSFSASMGLHSECNVYIQLVPTSKSSGLLSAQIKAQLRQSRRRLIQRSISFSAKCLLLTFTDSSKLSPMKVSCYTILSLTAFRPQIIK